jgi:cytochrome c-type biogenesis protein CcmH/NrfG
MKRPSIATELALTNQRLEFVCDQLAKISNENVRWNVEKSDMISTQSEHGILIKTLEKENTTQWKRIDWLWRSIWLVVISQVIMVILLFGAKFIPLIKI